MENVIPLFRKTEKPIIKRSSYQAQPFLDRLDKLYEEALILYGDMDKSLRPGEIKHTGITKERLLGYYEAMLDTIDSTCLLLTPTSDEDGMDEVS